jgi:hypothetical protein
VSTRIFNAFRLPASTDLPALCRQLRGQLTPVYRDRAVTAVALTSLLLITGERPEDDPEGLTGAVATEVARVISGGQVTEASLYGQFLLACAADIIDHLQEALARPGAQVVLETFDLAFSVAFLGDPDSEDWVYAKVFCDSLSYQRVWDALPGVEKFEYWDHTDGPQEISDADWDERKAIWDRVLGHHSAAQVGLLWKLVYPLPLAAEVLMSTPSVPEVDWLTVGAVADRIISVSESPVWGQRRGWLLERLAGASLGKENEPGPALQPRMGNGGVGSG